MICQFCEVEYPANVRSCAKCGCDLVDRLAAEGQELTFDPLPIVVDRDIFAALVAELESGRIPYTVQCGTGLQMFETQSLGAVAGPETWEARLMVISSRHAEAEAAWRAAVAGAEAGARGFRPDAGGELDAEELPHRVRRFDSIEPR